MSALAEALRTALTEACSGKAVVVWYDAGATLSGLVSKAAPEGRQLFEHDGSFLETRVRFEEADPRLEDRWLIYVPEARPEPSWLRDLELLGGRPLELGLAELVSKAFGLSTTPRLRSLLRSHLGRVLAARWEELVANETPSAADLQRALLAAALDLGADPQLRDIVTEYVTAADAPARITKTGLQRELRDLLETDGGLNLGANSDVPESRVAAAMLLSEAVEHGALDPSTFGEALPVASKRAQWASWAEGWSQRADDTSFQRWSGEVARLYAVRQHLTGPAESTPVQVAHILSFSDVDEVLARQVGTLLERDDLDELREVALLRLRTPWARAAERRGHPLPWRAALPALELLRGADKAAAQVSAKASWTLDDLLARYEEKDGWWQLDWAYRQLDASWGQLPHDLTKQLALPAARAYGLYLDLLGTETCRSLEARDTWSAKGWKTQRAVASSVLAENGRVAVVLADALRFDLGHLLAERLRCRGFEVETVPTLAELPSVTQVGMAAIQTPAWKDREVAVETGTAWYPKVEGKVLRNRDDRLGQLRSQYPDATAVELADVGRRRLPARSGQLVVFASAIDEQGDALPQVGVDVLERLTWDIADAVEQLLNAGVSTVAVVPDHGFVLVPHGYELHRVEAPPAGAGTARSWRYAVGHPSSSEGALRLPATKAGWHGDATVSFPRGLAVFSLPGEAPRFFHGGPMPQEAAVLSVVCRRSPTLAPPVRVRLVAPEHIDTALPTFTLEGEAEELLSQPRTVRVVVRFNGEQVAQSEPMEVQATERRMARVRLARYGKEVEVVVEDTSTGQQLDARVLHVELPSGYEDLGL